LKTIFFILKLLNRSSGSNYKVIKSVLFRFRNQAYINSKVGPFHKLKLFLELVVFTLKILFGRFRIHEEAVVFNGGDNDPSKVLRSYHIRNNNIEEEITFINSISKFSGKLNISKLFKVVGVFFLALLCSFFRKESIERKSVISLYSGLIQLCYLSNSTQIIFYQVGLPHSYLLLQAASEFFPKFNYIVVGSNSLLYSDNRYFHLPNCKFKYCSKVQLEELKIYQRNNWFKSKTVDFWGLEESLFFDKLDVNKVPSYDIAIYSSGGWARQNNLMQMDAIQLNNEGINKENLLYKLFNSILQVVIVLKQEHGVTAVIYPHPHERRLMKSGVVLPYLKLAKEHGIEINLHNDNSIQEIFSSKLAVASVSTMVFDRLNFDLKGFVFSGKGQKDFLVNPVYLGSYSWVCYNNNDELKNKIETELKLL